MPTEYKPLTVYRIRETIGGVPVQTFEDALVEVDSQEPDILQAYDLVGQYDFEARLFVARPRIKRPPWQEFLEEGFGELDDVLAEGITNSAVLIVKVEQGRVNNDRDIFFAFTCGFGRYLLKRGSYKLNYGLRVALSAIYKSGSSVIPRVRSVDAKTVAANTLHTRRQADRWANFETFEVDVQRDLLRAITGQPVEVAEWGTRVAGSNALTINRAVTIGGLGTLCEQIERISQQRGYRERFSWVDNVRSVTNVQLRAGLEGCLLEKLKERDVENLELAPPEIVTWDEIAHFRFSIAPDDEYDDLRLGDYLDILEDAKRLHRLTIRQLRTRHKLEVMDAAANATHCWSIFACLTGELEFEGKTYLISGGDFFEVAKDYMDALDRYVGSLPEFKKHLPASINDMKEGFYNQRAADSSPNYLLLDRQTVRVTNRTSPIEICDVFTTDGEFIHVKRKLGSSDLSHLFGQGAVSGDLFLMSPEYRRKMLESIRNREKDRVKDSGDTSFLGRFSIFDPNVISPTDYEVVYGIIADWNDKSLVKALPFFSKVNLRRHCDDLHRLGYRVSYKRIPVTYVYTTHVDRVTPKIPGLIVHGESTPAGSIRVSNGTGSDLYLLDQGGEEVLRISATGEILSLSSGEDSWQAAPAAEYATYSYPPLSYSGPRPKKFETVVSTWLVKGRVGDTPIEIHGQTVYEESRPKTDRS